MRVARIAHPLSRGMKDAWVREHCKSCPDFLHKQENAETFSLWGGEAGVWDFQTCYLTCWKDQMTKHDYSNLAYYCRKVGAL